MSDYITHIKDGNKTWCGRKVEITGWYFQDINHAIMTRRSEGRLLVCKKCAKAIQKVLESEK